MKWDIKSRLNELHRTGELQTGRQLAETLKAPAEDRLFPGEGREEETAFGRCYMRELRFSLDHRHGSGRLEGILNCSGPQIALPARDAGLESFEPQRSVFLDIETTGLSGGTGTWAFLIGLGWLEENHFLLRQYFLRRPAEERSILSHFAAEADKYPTMITFNGKMFDLPLIQTRQMLAGFRQTMPEQHLDLLQCARVLWKKRLESRSLRSIEESLLGLHRYDDIPGAEIPAVYFDYLR
ncbi:MAG: ribonuclease H-like domain-containing protein, partial [Firmicutes bacterium]|nr:ribonuclease H-like domain-containing protein [Bacillota bacterium]